MLCNPWCFPAFKCISFLHTHLVGQLRYFQSLADSLSSHDIFLLILTSFRYSEISLRTFFFSFLAVQADVAFFSKITSLLFPISVNGKPFFTLYFVILNILKGRKENEKWFGHFSQLQSDSVVWKAVAHRVTETDGRRLCSGTDRTAFLYVVNHQALSRNVFVPSCGWKETRYKKNPNQNFLCLFC